MDWEKDPYFSSFSPIDIVAGRSFQTTYMANRSILDVLPLDIVELVVREVSTGVVSTMCRDLYVP